MGSRATYRSGGAFRPAGIRRFVAAAVIVAAAAANLSFSSAPAVVITRLTDLGFGDVAIASTKQILHGDAEAASFRVDATNLSAQAGLRLSFTLPTVLSASGNAVPVSFAAGDAAWSYANGAGGVVAFDPNTGTFVAKQGTNFTVFVRIGGRVTTDGSTIPLTYTNTLLLDVEVL